MEVGAAEFSIGDGTDAGFELFGDDGRDLGVFDGAELLSGDFPFDLFLASFLYGCGAEEGTDVVSAVDTCWKSHG